MKTFVTILTLLLAPLAWGQDNIFYPEVYNNGGQIVAAVASSGACPPGSCIGIQIPTTVTTITVGVLGTFSATLQPEESQDGGYTWTSAGAAITTPGTTVYTVTAFTTFRVRASAYVSGVANVNIQAGPTGGSGSAGAGVTSLNGLVGGVTLAAGANITITPAGNTLTIASSGGGGGTVFPLTVSGAVTSGGIPCFTSTTTEASSALLPATDIVVGGGAGACVTASALQVVASTVQNSVASTAVIYQGGQDASSLGNLGFATLRGANQTGAGGALSAGGAAIVTGGSNVSTNAASQAGSVELIPGSSTAATQGLQGLLFISESYVKGGGTSTQWNLQCIVTTTAMTVNDCAASPQNVIGVALQVNTNTVLVHILGSQTPVNASAAVTVGHTVCAGTTAGTVTDSGGTAACTTGFTVGQVIATSGTWILPISGSVTITTTLPLIAFNRTSGVGNAANVPFSGITSGTNTTAAMICGTGCSLSSVPQFNIGAVGTAGVLGLVGSTSGTATITGPAIAGTSTNAIAFSNVISVPAGSATNVGVQVGAVNSGLYNVGGGLVVTSPGNIFYAVNASASASWTMLAASVNGELQPGADNTFPIGDATHRTSNIFSTNYSTSKLLISATAPTISSGFGTGPSIPNNNGTAAFTINVGTGGAATTGVIGLPAASTGWIVFCSDITTQNATVDKTQQIGAGSTTTVTIGNFTDLGVAGAWVASDILSCTAHAY